MSPVHKCSNGKYRIGEGKCMYDSKEKAETAYKSYLAQKNENDIEKMLEWIETELTELYDMESYLWSLKNIKEYEEKGIGDKIRIISAVISNEKKSIDEIKEKLDEIKNA